MAKETQNILRLCLYLIAPGFTCLPFTSRLAGLAGWPYPQASPPGLQIPSSTFPLNLVTPDLIRSQP